jgi:hypothetical protein
MKDVQNSMGLDLCAITYYNFLRGLTKHENKKKKIPEDGKRWL